MTLAIEVELLAGRYTATHFNDRTIPEWPPHPARLYSAMVNAWGEADDPDPGEADALRWLEGLGDPAIRCSARTDDPETNQVAFRASTTHFVPVNDPAAVRDLRGAYANLTESRAALASATESGDGKALARAEKARDKAEAKAVADSRRAASSGVAPTTALQLLPELRGKQARTYPTVRPADATLTVIWPKAEPDPATSAAIDGLLARIGRLGHSSSPVSCRVVDEAPEPTYVPATDGETLMRLAGPGQFDRLCEMYGSHQGRDPRQLPARMVRYGLHESPPPKLDRSVLAGTFIATAIVKGPKLSVRSSLPLAQAVRAAILHHAGRSGTEVPELISGHVPRTAGIKGPTESSSRPHMAVVPLPFVGHTHADGLIKGIAIVAPTDADEDERQQLLRAVGLWVRSGLDPDEREENLWGPTLGDQRWTIERAPVDQTPVTLSRSRWSSAATRWATVTPIVLDRYPDGLWRGSAAKRARAETQAIESITDSCAHIGLPAPLSVEIRSDAPILGVAPLRRYPQLRNGPDRAPRVGVHAIIEFRERVVGPVILGRGRYLGQGLCLPLRKQADGE